MWLQKVCLVSLQVVLLLALVSAQCSVNLRTDIPAKDPVYLTRTGALWSPNGAALTWAAGEETILACTGSSNSLKLNGQSTSTISCNSGNTFSVGGVSATSDTLECTNTITGDYQVTGTSCGNGAGSLINLGYNLDSLGFTTYIQSCYDLVTGSVRYTRHVLPGRAIDYSMIESSRPSFKSSGTASHVSPATSYTQASQMTRLSELFGSSAEAEKYLSTNSYLARGHLAPDGDGIFRSWSFTTYFYTNVAPEWQVVNAGNWLRVENAARKVASSSQADLTVFTGTFDVLTLPDVNGNPVKISLEAGGNIEVPKWFWKIIKNPANNSGIALVTLNNPFVDSISSSERLCTDICASTGWYEDAFSNFAKGLTYCCEVGDLMQTISFIPSEAAASSILYKV